MALDRLRRGLEWVATLWGIMPPNPANGAWVDSGSKSGTLVRGDEVDTIIGRMMIANELEELARAG